MDEEKEMDPLNSSHGSDYSTNSAAAICARSTMKMLVFVHVSLDVATTNSDSRSRRDSMGDSGRCSSLSTAINRSSHARQNLSKSLLQLFTTRTEPDPLDRPRSPHVASPHDLVDEPPCLAVRV